MESEAEQTLLSEQDNRLVLITSNSQHLRRGSAATMPPTKCVRQSRSQRVSDLCRSAAAILEPGFALLHTHCPA